MPYAGLQIVLFSLNFIVRLIRLGFLGTGPQVSSAVHIMVSGFGGVPKIKSIYEKLFINVYLKQNMALKLRQTLGQPRDRRYGQQIIFTI